MKKILCIIALLSAFVCSHAQFSKVTHIDDLALIYIGSQHRPQWDKDLFRPYVMHTFPDSTQSWFFDGFLMLEFMRWNDAGERVNLGEALFKPSTKDDWIAMLDMQLGVGTDTGCKALDDLIGELIPVLGKPGHKHKVVMSLPVNRVKGDWYWGEIDGRKLYGDDRVEEMKWYIDELLRRWDAAGFKNIELDGVYWTKEGYVAEEDADFEFVTAYAKKKGLLNYWIPYRSARGRGDWKEWGIDVAYLQPNYYFKDERPMDWLDGVIDFAFGHDMGLEIEFAGYDYSYNPTTGHRELIKPHNIGLYDINPQYYQRLADYLNHFELYGVFDKKPVAYYTGFQGVYDFSNSDNRRDRDLMSRMARIVNLRHQATRWDKAPRPAKNRH